MEKKRNEKEQELATQFKKFLDKSKQGEVIYNKVRSRTRADLEIDIFIKGKKERLYGEVKTAYSTNKYNNVLLIYGDIMKMRNLYKKDIACFLMFPQDSDDFFRKRIKMISKEDWMKFGDDFRVKYVFLFDNELEKLYIQKWNDYYLDNEKYVNYVRRSKDGNKR